MSFFGGIVLYGRVGDNIGLGNVVVVDGDLLYLC